MFERVKNFLGISAATQLPAIAPPKVKPGTQSFPSYLKTTRPSDALLPQTDRRLASTDTTTLRSGANTSKIIRDFVAASPDLSAAVWAYVRLGIPQKFTIVAKNQDRTFNREATQLVQQLATRFDKLPDYAADGFTGPTSIRAISESLGREVMMYGSLSGELVLGKDRLPRRVQPISVTQVKFIADPDKTLRPMQYIGAEKIDLDYPTFIYCTLDQDLLEPYSSSPIESAIKPVINSEQFSNDISRIVGRVIHPRQKVKIDEDKVRKNLSTEAQMDPALAVTELNAIIAGVESKINGLNPEDALVYLDSLGFEVENASNAGLSAEYKVLQEMANARMATGSKTNGTVLGFSSGSSNIASSEIMLFMRSVTGAVKAPLEEFWSRVFTLSARLYGFDVVVEFQYASIDLRPDAELMVYKQTEQAMVLEQLSLGLITDDEACLRLTGNLTPEGYKSLSGTMFKGSANAVATDPQNPSNNGSTLNKNLTPDTPSQGRGQNKKAEGGDLDLEAQVSEPSQQPLFVMPDITVNVDNTQQSQASVLKMRRDEDGNLTIERLQDVAG